MRILRGTWPYRLGGLALLLAMAGCATPPERIARYIAKHPERPADICAALQQQSVTTGMTAEEVRLCLGGPNRIDRIGGAGDIPPIETWRYLRDSSTDGSLKGSSLWAMDIPLATVYFSREGLVNEAAFYDSPEPEALATVTTAAAPPEVTRKAPVNVQALPPAQKPRPKPPTLTNYTPSPDELGVSGWPRVMLGGVSAMSGGHGAILNDEIVEPGETIEGVSLFRVFANGVLLDYRGQRTFLRNGETTK